MMVAVLIPCYNEAITIDKVVRDFRRVLPHATVYVYDNMSTDGTGLIAEKAGAVVRRASPKGKGNTVRQMLLEIDADAYILVDGDDTYHAGSAVALLQALREADMVVARRIPTKNGAFSPSHRLGNWAFQHLAEWLFGSNPVDVLSGYRALSPSFVRQARSVLQTEGFEIEMEMTGMAVSCGLKVEECSTPYQARPDGSHSKLSTVGDGLRILFCLLQEACKSKRSPFERHHATIPLRGRFRPLPQVRRGSRSQ